MNENNKASSPTIGQFDGVIKLDFRGGPRGLPQCQTCGAEQYYFYPDGERVGTLYIKNSKPICQRCCTENFKSAQLSLF